MSWSSGNSNNKNVPHQNEKRACEVCEQRVMHYKDGSVEKHDVYLYEKKKGIYHRTSKKKNCDNKRWN